MSAIGYKTCRRVPSTDGSFLLSHSSVHIMWFPQLPGNVVQNGAIKEGWLHGSCLAGAGH